MVTALDQGATPPIGRVVPSVATPTLSDTGGDLLPLSTDPVLRSKQTGDMYVQVMVETPQHLTKKQKELLAEFEKISSQENNPESAGFFAKVKDFFEGLGNRPGSA